MISLGRRDGREEGILGFGGGGGGGRRGMEETELEEGEACSYDNNLEEEGHDYCSEMNPDIDFSYIDEKIQNVLGHFQKDFEGGVSAENLGPKFGGYGSFLPTYQRSPVWSHSRTPPKAQLLNAPKSPNHLQLEGGHHSSVSSTNTVQSGRPKTSFSVAPLLPESKTPSSVFDSVKLQVGVPSTLFLEEPGSGCENANINSDNSSDLKTLKVRIKVGADNLSTRKNAAIYSGLGLDISPSSSLDGCTSDSEGIPNEPRGALETPALIIQMMTVFPVQGDQLLSPLGNDFILLAKKDKLLMGRPSLPFPGTASRSSKSASKSAADACDFVEDDGKKSGEKKIKSLTSDNISEETIKESNDFRSAVHGILGKDADVDTLACGELVSNTLKLPLLSSSQIAFSGMGKMDRASPMSKESKGVEKDRALSNLKREEHSVQKINTEDFVIQNSKATSGAKIAEVRKISSVTHITDGQEEDGHLGKEKADSNVDEGRKAQSSKQTVPPKQKAEQKTSACELEVTKLASAKEDSEVQKKKASKKQGKLVADLPRESLGVESLSAGNSVNRRHADEFETKGKVKDSQLHKNDRIGDRYREFFGDLELEVDENQRSTLEIGGPDGSEFERRRCGIDDTTNERSGCKKIDTLSTFETCGQAAPRSPLHTTDGSVSDAAHAASASIVAEDNWVCCDKCQTWRLLPLGKNPNDLPEKWICSMLNWLPGMNHCRFSEQETTNALIALYHASGPESQIDLQKDTGVVKSTDSLEGLGQHDNNQKNIGVHEILVGGKKRGSKEHLSAPPKEGSTQFSNPGRKNKQALSSNGHGNNVRQSTLTSDPDMRPGNPGDMMMEMHGNKRKDKYKDLHSHSDKDDSKRSKMKEKRDSDQVFDRTSKKAKTDHLAEEWISNNDGTIVKAGTGSGKSYLHTSSGKNVSKLNDCSSFKDLRYELTDGAQVSYKRPRDRDRNSLDDKSLGKRELDDRDTLKKRKTKEGSHLCSLSNSGPHLHDTRILGKDHSDNEYRKKKKSRPSRTEGNGRMEKNNHKRNQQAKVELGCTKTQRSMDGVDSFKRDSGTQHPSLAATSSSSKVSGSHKTKASFHDLKGSPVESVSSSPLRVSKPEKLMSTTANVTENDDSIGVGLNLPGGLKGCSDADDDGRSNRFGSARKENTLDVAYRDSFESVVIDHQEKNSCHLSRGEARVDIIPSPNATNHQCSDGEHKQHPDESTSLDRCYDDGRQVKLGKGSSLGSRDRNIISSSDFDNSKDKVPMGKQIPSSGVKQLDGHNKVGIRSDENQDEYMDKKVSTRPLTSENGKTVNKSQFEGHNDPNVKIEAIGSHELISASKKCLVQNSEAVSGKNDLSLGAQGETLGSSQVKDPSSKKVNGSDVMADNVPDNKNILRDEKQVGKVGHSNGMQNGSSGNLMSNGHRIKEDAPSTTKRDSSNQAATNAMKEAKNLKHKADRLKYSGMTFESTRLYFEAALKFLHGASLLETGSNDSAKNGEMKQSMQIYSSTAKLCNFCAHEYEKSKDMAAAALAYKCTEVAYMRVVYGSYGAANRERHELQRVLQMVPPGESPSSSASDVDNLNHLMGEKGTLSKGTSSPQVAGSHVIAARSHPSSVRLLNFAQDVNFAIEASRKSRIAFAAAVVNSGEAQLKDGILSVKTALDFSFQDVEGLLRLVRLAFDSISN